MLNWNSGALNDLINSLSPVAEVRNCLAVEICVCMYKIQVFLKYKSSDESAPKFLKELNNKLLLGFVCNLSPVLCPGLTSRADLTGIQ